MSHAADTQADMPAVEVTAVALTAENQPPELSEHKYEFARRMKEEGTEKEAEEFRVAKRKEFRKQGLGVQESRDAAWAAAMEKFPPIEKQVKNDMAFTLAMARFPVEDCIPPEPGQFDFASVYYVWHGILAGYQAMWTILENESRFSHWDQPVRQHVTYAWSQSSKGIKSPAEQALFDLFHKAPFEFLDIAKDVFTRELENQRSLPEGFPSAVEPCLRGVQGVREWIENGGEGNERADEQVADSGVVAV